MKIPAALLLLALVLRLGVVGFADVRLVGDPADYVRHAKSIARTGHYPPSAVTRRPGPTAVRPPVYPYALGAACAVFGHCATTARVLNAFLGTLLVALIGMLAASIWDRRAGLAAMGVGAVAPPLIVAGTAALTEAVFGVLVVACVLATMKAPDGRRWLVIAGALAGLAVLTRPNGAAFIPAVLLGLALAGRGRQRWQWPLAALATSVLVIAPWTVRNLVVFDKVVLVSTSGGFTLAGTYNDAARLDPRFPGMWRVANADAAYRRLLRRTAADDEPARGAALGRAARRYATDHPGYVPTVVFHNVTRWMQLDGWRFGRISAGSEGVSARLADLERVGWLALALLAAVGIALGGIRRRQVWIWLVPVLLLASVAPIVSAVRFRDQVDIFATLLAGYALAVLGSRLLAGRRPGALSRR